MSQEKSEAVPKRLPAEAQISASRYTNAAHHLARVGAQCGMSRTPLLKLISLARVSMFPMRHRISESTHMVHTYQHERTTTTTPQSPYHHTPTPWPIFLHYAANQNHHLHSQSTPLPPKRCGKGQPPPSIPTSLHKLYTQRFKPSDSNPEIHSSARAHSLQGTMIYINTK
jgi:hypothetical protein